MNNKNLQKSQKSGRKLLTNEVKSNIIGSYFLIFKPSRQNGASYEKVIHQNVLPDARHRTSRPHLCGVQEKGT
jgi:hypothetical protein